MSTYVVWVLILASHSYGTHFGVVDNIASQANCRALGAQATQGEPYADYRCIAVRKVRP